MHHSHTAPAQPRRILVVRNRFIGDTMLAIPFLRNLRRQFPHAIIDVLCEAGAMSLLDGCPYVDELLEWRRPARTGRVIRGSLANVIATARWIRERRYDRVYLLKRSLSSALLAWLADIPWRVGFRSFGSSLLSRALPVVPHRHQADLFLDLLRSEGISVDEGHGESWTTEKSIVKAEAMLADVVSDRPRVFLAPHSTDKHRLWPLERFARLVDWLVAQRGCEIFLSGGPGDRPMHDAIMRLVAPATARHLHDHSADISLRDLGGFLSRMDLCIGVDSGLNHVAAANGVPVVVLVGPTDPNRWHPWQATGEVVKGVPRRRLLRGNRRFRDLPWNPEPASMNSIVVEQVMEAVDRLLPRRPVRGAMPRRAMRVVDLRQGSFRYAVLASSRPAAAAEPATKPLAQAH